MERHKPRFEVYEMVRVDSGDPSNATMNGMVGEVEFRRYFDGLGWYYTIEIAVETQQRDAPSKTRIDLLEHELQSTGVMGKRFWLEHRFPPRFGFNEKVRLVPDSVEKRQFQGELGFVQGRSQDAQGGWHYAVVVYRDNLVYGFTEAELITTGEFELLEQSMSDTWIVVRVDEEGRGEIVDDIAKESNT